MKIDKKWIILSVVVLVIFITSAIVVPLRILSNNKIQTELKVAQTEYKAIQDSFISTHSKVATANARIVPAEIKYVVFYSNGGYDHLEIFINGIWVEIARTESVKTDNTKTEE